MVQMKIMSIGAVSVLPFKQDVIDSLSYGGKVESVRPLMEIEDIVRDNKYRGQKNRDLKLDILLWSNKQYSAENFYEYIVSNIGATLPIVAFVLENNMYQANGQCCDCGGKSNGCCVSYISALGVITKVSELKQGDYNEAPEVSISIEITTYWTALDYMSWRKVDASEYYSQFPVEPTLDVDYSLPDCRQLFRKCPDCTFVLYPQQYCSYDFMYDPVYMSKSLSGFSCGCGGNCCAGKQGFVSTYMKPLFLEKFNVKRFYGAPPKPFIVFDGITGTEDITLRTISSKSSITRKTYNSLILVSETNSILVENGLDPLGENDKIVLGQFTWNQDGTILRNAMIVRDGQVITTVQPIIATNGSFFGYIEPAEDVRVFGIGNFNFVHVKYLFRRA